MTVVRAVTDDSFEADVLRSAKPVIVEYAVKVNEDENPRTTAR